MKHISIISLLVVSLTSFLTVPANAHGIGNFGVFYRALDSYGEWIDFDGLYVWRPLHVRYGWRPYVYGRWVWTNYGWYWYSYEPFGWVTFHYGRWYYDDYYGWIWIPDLVWGPAWVEWRYNNSYIGWAPLPPHSHFNIHIGITFRSAWVAPVHYWNFVPCDRFVSTRIANYVQPIEQTRRIIGSTRSGVNIEYDQGKVVNRGVDVSFIENRVRTRIPKVDVVQIENKRGEQIRREKNQERIEVHRFQTDGTSHPEISRPTRSRKAERPLYIGDENNFQHEEKEHRRTRRDRASDNIQVDKFKTPPKEDLDRRFRRFDRELNKIPQQDFERRPRSKDIYRERFEQRERGDEKERRSFEQPEGDKSFKEFRDNRERSRQRDLPQQNSKQLLQRERPRR